MPTLVWGAGFVQPTLVWGAGFVQPTLVWGVGFVQPSMVWGAGFGWLFSGMVEGEHVVAQPMDLRPPLQLMVREPVSAFSELPSIPS